jgi:endonuclease/exonuclease/phosphatase family metal-dependent hydrolase
MNVKSDKEIEIGNFAPTGWKLWPQNSIRVIDWNIDRGLQLRAIIDFLGDAKADILILQEVDMNARRTHRLNIAQEIAQKLRLNYVFGREFVELTQGSDTSPAYHGQATLSRWKISNSRIVRFQQQSDFWKPRWYLPKVEPFQERLGGRIALVSEIDISGVSIASYNLHLESRANDDLRLAQLADPAPAEAIARAGFTQAVPSSRLTTTPTRHLLEPGRHIDWAFVRGPVQIDKERVHNSIKASDHYPISFEIGLSSGH